MIIWLSKIGFRFGQHTCDPIFEPFLSVERLFFPSPCFSCTIFLKLFMPFPPCDSVVYPRLGKCIKKKQMSHAGGGGTAHATEVRVMMPLIVILRPFSSSQRGGRLQFAPARMALMRFE